MLAEHKSRAASQSAAYLHSLCFKLLLWLFLLTNCNLEAKLTLSSPRCFWSWSLWLQQEVIRTGIQWEKLLHSTHETFLLFLGKWFAAKAGHMCVYTGCHTSKNVLPFPGFRDVWVKTPCTVRAAHPHCIYRPVILGLCVRDGSHIFQVYDGIACIFRSNKYKWMKG